jgi:multiple sugar transport system substrate-binding protein
VAVSACGSGGGGGSGTPTISAQGSDDGAKVTMWVRSATDTYSQRLVGDYNATHKNKVSLTIVPSDSYLQKVGAAAGSHSLPDLLASDVVYSPNYVTQGLFQDVTAPVQALPHSSDLAQAHLKAAGRDGKIYAVPYKVDSSVFLYNKDLFRKAGLDPNKPPTTFADLYADAKAIRATGADTYGFYFPGNCAGCNAYTMFPYAVADGHPPISADGKTADLKNDAFTQATALYKRLVDEQIAPSSVKTDDGANWTALFYAGKVGILPGGSFMFADMQTKVKFDWGVAGLMAPSGGKSATFVGGDVLGVSRDSKKAAEAFNFVAYALDQHAQVDIVAKNGDLPVRTDLSGNQYSAADARVSATVKGLVNGYTPSALPYGDLFNNANGPWILGIRGAIFGADPSKALGDMQSAIQAGLAG